MAPTNSAKPFTHLHLHSMYSLLDGGNRIDKLCQQVKALGMNAVAVTDHGNLHAAAEFYKTAKAHDLKPILGIEAYIAPDTEGRQSDRTDRTFTGVSDGGFHLVLLAENQQGWANLLKLSSDAYLNGFYFKPRMDKSTLEQWSEGLIAINGHLGSSIAFHMVKYHQTRDPSHFKRAKAEALWHRDLFGTNEQGQPRFYLELQRHAEQLQCDIVPHVAQLAAETGIPLVCDNDAHFLTADDHDAHDTLCCISMGKIKSAPDRMRYPHDLYVKSPQEMWQAFGEDHPEALLNTQAIADRCDVTLDFEANHAPVVKIRKTANHSSRDREAIASAAAGGGEAVGSTEWFKAFCAGYDLIPFDSENDTDSPDDLAAQCDRALRELCEAGLIWRYGVDGITDAIRARLDRELTVLGDKSISAYFLIVWDFVNYARQQGIPAMARGSGVGTMVGYVLGLSNACPVAYGLLFERFTDPDRSEYPDIDIDLCQDGRQGVIEYVRQKYGHVAQIITFGTLKARAAIRDVGRVLDVPLGEVDRVCKLVTDALGITLDKALEKEPDLRKLYDDSPQHKAMIDTARRLEGLARHAGVHAAGVIVATQPLDNIVPLYKPPGPDAPVTTQWDGPTCEKVGLLKMDFLGLRTLSIIERAKKLIRRDFSTEQIRQAVPAGSDTAESLDDPLDLDRLTYNDPAVFDLFARGDTAGVFQFESGGMRNLLMSMKPDRLEDLIAANALFRPGPMELIPNYCNRKHGREAVPASHEIVEKFTGETYGIMVYQEQVMQIVHELGGIPLRAAYSLIKAISKKKSKIINAERGKFIQGAGDKGVAEKDAAELFDLILKFAGYGFNKSHSTGYAIVAYQTAYLKTYFPLQYMAAVLTYESVSTEKVVEYASECKNVKLPTRTAAGVGNATGRPAVTQGIEVKPPDINLSDIAFTVVFDDGQPKVQRTPCEGHIRFGLAAVKGVGDKAIMAMIDARREDGLYKGLFDFCSRVDLRSVNRSTVEALIKCGAFDSIHGQDKRAALCEVLDDAIKAGQRAAADRASGQMSIFGLPEAGPAAAADPSPEPTLPSTPPWSQHDTLAFEKEVLGFYASSHPLDAFRSALDQFASVDVETCLELAADTRVVVGGMLSRVRQTVVKNGRSAGQKMAMITLEDGRHKIDGVCFSDTYATCYPSLELDQVVLLCGKIDRRREEANIVIDDVIPVRDAPARLTRALKIVVHDTPPPDRNGQGKDQLARLRELLRQMANQTRHQGSGSGSGSGPGQAAEVLLELHQHGRVAQLRLGPRVAIDDNLLGSITTILSNLPGRDARCELQGPPRIRRPAAKVQHESAGDLSFAMHDDAGLSIDRY